MQSPFQAPQNTISVIVPALNEAHNLTAAVEEVTAAVEPLFDDYEILIFNDASSDDTGTIAEQLASRNPKISVIHNTRNMGLGWNYKRGIELARMYYVTLVNGKHDITNDQLYKIFSLRGEADIIIPYHTNAHERSRTRQLISKSFTFLLNLLFGYNLRYYNDSSLHRTEFLKTLRLRTTSYAITAEILIKALKSGLSYHEVAIENIYPPQSGTSAFRLINFWGVAVFLLYMLYDVYFARNYHET